MATRIANIGDKTNEQVSLNTIGVLTLTLLADLIKH